MKDTKPTKSDDFYSNLLSETNSFNFMEPSSDLCYLDSKPIDSNSDDPKSDNLTTGDIKIPLQQDILIPRESTAHSEPTASPESLSHRKYPTITSPDFKEHLKEEVNSYTVPVQRNFVTDISSHEDEKRKGFNRFVIITGILILFMFFASKTAYFFEEGENIGIEYDSDYDEIDDDYLIDDFGDDGIIYDEEGSDDSLFGDEPDASLSPTPSVDPNAFQ